MPFETPLPPPPNQRPPPTPRLSGYESHKRLGRSRLSAGPLSRRKRTAPPPHRPDRIVLPPPAIRLTSRLIRTSWSHRLHHLQTAAPADSAGQSGSARWPDFLQPSNAHTRGCAPSRTSCTPASRSVLRR